jgi:hypothetical protein
MENVTLTTTNAWLASPELHSVDKEEKEKMDSFLLTLKDKHTERRWLSNSGSSWKNRKLS